MSLVLLLVAVFSLRAQTQLPPSSDSLRMKVLYPVNRTVLLENFAGNELELARLDRVLETTPPGDIRVLLITSAASPEGPFNGNVRLALGRADAIRKYILARRPDLAPIIEVETIPEAWEELRQLDPDAPQSEDEKTLRAHPSFRFYLKEFMPGLRYARVNIAPRLYALPSWESEGYLPQITIPGLEIPAVKPAALRRRTILAVKTNLLFDAASMLNYGIELPLGDRMSLAWEHYFPWWVLRNNRICVQYLTLGGEARWWFAPKPVPESRRFAQRDRLVGHYFGVYGFWGKTDLQWDKVGCYQCDNVWSAGLTYGFSVPVTRHLNLEFSASVGYARIPYQHYNPSADWQTLWRDYDDVGTTHYFGPTKLQISLVWPIQIQYRVGGGASR